MITTELIYNRNINEYSHIGGEPVVVHINWDGAKYSAETLYRLLIQQYNNEYINVGYCYSAYGYINNSNLDIGSLPYIIKAQPRLVAEHTDYLSYLIGYLPKLVPGIYYIQPEYYNNATSLWTEFGTKMKINVLSTYRANEIYELRKLWPEPAFNSGIKNIQEEPIINEKIG